MEKTWRKTWISCRAIQEEMVEAPHQSRTVHPGAARERAQRGSDQAMVSMFKIEIGWFQHLLLYLYLYIYIYIHCYLFIYIFS